MNPKLRLGEKAPDFTLPCVDGTTVRLTDQLARQRATVVMFLCNHCPYVKAYIPRLIQLQCEFAATDGGRAADAAHSPPPCAGLIGVCSNDADTYPDDRFENMKVVAQAWGLNFPYLRDEDQQVARAYGAERTPEVFVLDSGGVCRYEGGIDDSCQDPAGVTQRPLRDAIWRVIHREPVTVPHTHAIGCTVKWKKQGG